MEAAYLIFRNVKSHICLCCIAKMTFNKSHLGMCMVTRLHFITIKISPVGQSGGQGHVGSCPLHSLPLAPPIG